MWGRGLLGLIPVVVTMLVAPPVSANSYPVVPTPLSDPAAGAARVIEGRAPRALILGDSIADQHGSHAAVALRQAGMEVKVAARWGGSFFTRDQYDMGVSQPNPPPDTLMARASEMVATFDPDVVAVYSNHNYWPPFPRDANGQEIGLVTPESLETRGWVPTPEFVAMAQTQLRELVRRLKVNGAKVYLVEPHPVDGGATAAENPFFTAYMGVQAELGLGVIRTGRLLASAEGQSIPEFGDCAGQPISAHPSDDPLHLTYFGAGVMGSATAMALADALQVPLSGSTAPGEQPAVLLPAGLGYRVVTCDGATFGFVEEASNLGGVALGGGRLDGDPVVAATTTAYGRRGWMLTRSGMVFPVGGAPHFGNAVVIGDTHAAVGIASAPRATGYWIATSSGVVQAFGGVQSLGDLAAQGEEIVAMASAPGRQGYWLLTASGRIEGFGDAPHFGDLRDNLPAEPLVGMTAHPSGQGYWVLDRAGNVYPLGVARDLGSAANQELIRLVAFRGEGDFDAEPVPAAEFPTHAVSMLPTVSGEGYWVALANGAVCHFGDAPPLGGLHIAEVQGMSSFFGGVLYANDSPCSRRTREGELVVGGDQPYVPRLALLG